LLIPEADVNEATITSLFLSDATALAPMLEALIPSVGKRIIFFQKLRTLGNTSDIVVIDSFPLVCMF
jgi:hypothetical protein